MATQTTIQQEIVAAPLQLYVAPISTAFPAVDATQSQITTGGWTLVGVNGNLDHDQAGATVTHNATYSTFTSVGNTAPTKIWRTNEQLEVSITLADISPASYALALNDVAVTTITATTGAAGEQDIPLLQGLTVACFALLAVGVSALNNNLQAMYCVPCVYQSAAPAPVYKLGSPAELALTFATILDPNGNGFGTFRQQTSARI
jgi:hypothetical protein